MKNTEIDIQRWLNEYGKIFLKEIGIKEKQIVLDFGCGQGHYTIPAARIVGKAGKVYAVDKDRGVLDELMKIVESTGLENIEPSKTEKELKVPNIDDESIDTILLYDIIHLVSDRNKLYKEVYRILKSSGLLSIYPKHCSSDYPGWGLKNMNLRDIIKEIEREGFYFEKKFFKKILHDDYLNNGNILNFRKKESE
ncbi:MAG: methyltransferase domain-containing protein [Candidatus Omnitrophica bacterium]|nr:methyltransferase domain-containing protein [Candidatus Omnitrophota bacterium]